MKRKNNFILWLIMRLVGIAALVYIKDLNTVHIIASQLHVSPSWTSIREDLFYKEYRIGMKRDEIHHMLDKIGPWKIISLMLLMEVYGIRIQNSMFYENIFVSPTAI